MPKQFHSGSQDPRTLGVCHSVNASGTAELRLQSHPSGNSPEMFCCMKELGRSIPEFGQTACFQIVEKHDSAFESVTVDDIVIQHILKSSRIFKAGPEGWIDYQMLRSYLTF